MANGVPNVASAFNLPYRPVLAACRLAHTEADGELNNFLVTEISREKQNLKERGSSLHPDLKGWEVEKKGAMVTLRKQFEDEQLLVRFNINNSVGQNYDEEEMDESGAQREAKSEEQLLSRPAFEIEIKRGNTTLAYNCVINETVASMFEGSGDQRMAKREASSGRGGASEEFVDLFDIEEMAIFEGKEMNDETYAVSGDVMDGDMYEHVMNLLDDRGIGPEFTVDLVKLATRYEQEQYVQTLEKLQQFVGGSGGAQKIAEKY